ncbi:hypothetical protein [Saccharothrix deserti]|uniref:hypothetical protein n=1 Tax=Saccharothrix deserti TaxID=2593674 RepID=UPI00131BBA5E|nr:hypothetical protein [Saccharothrix deserti]
MQERGFDYADPTAAISDPRWDLDTADVPAAEIDTARSDVRCKTSARYVEVWHEVEVGVQQDVISRDAERFASLATARETRLATARRILGT